MSLVFLDLLGVLLLGSIVAIATSAVQGRPLPGIINQSIEFLNLQNMTPQALATVFGVVATISLLSKSFLNYYLNLRNSRFLASREAKISARMAQLILTQPITTLQKFGTPEYQHSLTIGVNSATVGILAGTIAIVSEIFLQVVMATTLLVFSPTLLLIFVLYFGAIFLLLNWMLGEKANQWSARVTSLSIAGTRAIADSLGSYREIVVSGKRDHFISIFRKSREEALEFFVKSSMLGQFSKYVFENSVILGGVVFAGYAFFTKTALEAASLLAIFIAAASRIAPSILKIQLETLLLKGARGATSKFFEILHHLEQQSEQITSSINNDLDSSVIRFREVSFRYPSSDKNALSEFSSEFKTGEFTAIVGPTGSGKSTLIDLMLGVLRPTHGSISVFGRDPEQVPGSSIRVGYVPQRVYLSEGSLIENICFGESSTQWDEDRVWDVLDTVLLRQWAAELPEGLSTLIGEGGARLSGGQRQRLGIARALYANPNLLVLDEATSALDAISEYEITEAFERLDKGLTKVVIAHRLSTVLKADKIVYLKSGKIQGMGTFNELRELIPDFDRQAELMGISK
ncbi:MAG: ABC transporter ATP-binding protein [Actinomycetota bacterium]|nr:ABC transporter ATP-binding protein [Actinomycetota bacterium]